MRPRVWIIPPGGEPVELGVGDLVGRHPACALTLNDPRVSEAHAMVSLRGDALKLLALRGRLEVRSRAVTEVTLRPGLTVGLAPDVVLTVEEVELPDEVPALTGPGLPVQVLLGTSSLRREGQEVALLSGWLPDAQAWCWSAGDAWYVRTVAPGAVSAGEGGAEAEERAITAGDVVDVGGLPVRVVGVPLHLAGHPATVLEGSRESLRITLRFHHAEIVSPTRRLLLEGVPGRLLCEAAAMGGPTGWEVVARSIWGAEATLDQLRHRWDVNLARVRARLREAGIRADLLRADRSGNIVVDLGPDDVLVDEM